MSQGRAKIHRDYKPMVKAAEAVGWTLEPPRGKGHPRLVPPEGWICPDGAPATPLGLAGTPGDRRSMLNDRSKLRRAGIPC